MKAKMKTDRRREEPIEDEDDDDDVRGVTVGA